MKHWTRTVTFSGTTIEFRDKAPMSRMEPSVLETAPTDDFNDDRYLDLKTRWCRGDISREDLAVELGLIEERK